MRALIMGWHCSLSKLRRWRSSYLNCLWIRAPLQTSAWQASLQSSRAHAAAFLRLQRNMFWSALMTMLQCACACTKHSWAPRKRTR